MTTQAPDQRAEARKNTWVGAVQQLADQVVGWAEAQGWAVHREPKAVRESEFGTYDVPFLRVRTPYGEVHLDPIARNIYGRGDGRVDLEGWPSLNRVRLIRRGSDWEVITESNVPLRQPWGRDTFVQLAHDLTGKP